MFNFWNSPSQTSSSGIKETGVTPIKQKTSDLVQQRALAFGDDLTAPITSPSTAPAGKCVSCSLLIHKVERVSVDGNVFHKNCLRCGVLNTRQDVVGCNRLLPPTPDNYVIWQGVPYCKACHSKYFHHGQIKSTLGRVVDITTDDVKTSSTQHDRSSFNGSNTYVSGKIQEAERRVSRSVNNSRDSSPMRDRERKEPSASSPGALVVEKGVTTTVDRTNDVVTTSGFVPSSGTTPTTTTTTTTGTPSNSVVPPPNPSLSSSMVNLPPMAPPITTNGILSPSMIEPYWTEPYNPQAPAEVVLDDLNSLIQNLLLQVEYATSKQDPPPHRITTPSNTPPSTNGNVDNNASSSSCMTSQERETLLHSILNIDRLIAALSFPLPLTETSKPNGQEVVNDLVAFLSLLKIQPRIRERLVDICDAFRLSLETVCNPVHIIYIIYPFVVLRILLTSHSLATVRARQTTTPF